MLVVLIATVTVAGLAAAFVWGVLPELKKAFGEQTSIDNIDPNQLIPSVGASEETSVIPVIFTFGVVFFLLTAIFTPKPLQATKPAPALDQIASNYLL